MPKRKHSEATKEGWKTRRKGLNSKHNNGVKQRKLWDDGDMVKAMEVIISNSMGVNEAAKCYNVPPTMLKIRISGREKHGTKPGPQSYVPDTQGRK